MTDSMDQDAEEFRRCVDLLLDAMPEVAFPPCTVVKAMLTLAHNVYIYHGATHERFAGMLEQMAAELRRGDFSSYCRSKPS